MTSVPTTLVWYQFPNLSQTVNSTINSFGIYCLDQNGENFNPSDSAALTFTIWLAGNDQLDGSRTGCGGFTSGSTTTATTVNANEGIATFDNLAINTTGAYTFGCYVTSIAGSSPYIFPKQNLIESPPIVIVAA